MDGVRDLIGGEYPGQSVGVFRRDVRVLSRVPDEERWCRAFRHRMTEWWSVFYGHGPKLERAISWMLFVPDGIKERFTALLETAIETSSPDAAPNH